LLAAHVQSAFANKLTPEVLLDGGRTREVLRGVATETIPVESYELIEYSWELVQHNAAELRRQIGSMQAARTGRIDPGAHVVNENSIHIAAGATIKPGAVLDAEAGPILVGENAVVSSNATIQGPCFIGPHSIIQPSAIIREGTSIGPWCKVGGE